MLQVLFHGLNALIFLFIGVYCTVKAEVAAKSLGITFESPSGLTDFRATYGGMCLAVAIFFSLAAFYKVNLISAAHWLALFTYAGLGSVRLFGMIRDGSPTNMMYFFLACEIFLSIAAAYFLFTEPQQ